MLTASDNRYTAIYEISVQHNKILLERNQYISLKYLWSNTASKKIFIIYVPIHNIKYLKKCTDKWFVLQCTLTQSAADFYF